ncbi:MAG: peptide/nickel transport system substrate-binding protein, partial [Salinirussus sp.]
MPQDESESRVDRRTLLKAVGGAAATVSVAGCGGTQSTPTEGDDGGESEMDTPMDGGDTEETTTEAADEEAFSVGATLGQSDSGLDPHDHAETPTNIIVSQVYEGLMGRDKEGGVIAKLATEWERVESGTVRFTLRDGVTFHNGDPLTAEDVRYSIRRVELEEVGGALPQDGDLAGTGSLAGVEAGDGEVTVNFDGLNPIVFALFATNGQVMQRSFVENNENSFINRNTNGT